VLARPGSGSLTLYESEARSNAFIRASSLPCGRSSGSFSRSLSSRSRYSGSPGCRSEMRSTMR
jgi:hypothetical protein